MTNTREIMTGREKFILGSTFAMGILSGLFFYATVYAPSFQEQVDVLGAPSPDAVTIEGKMYGGCQRTDSCGSFKLGDTRRYQYIPNTQSEVQEGTVTATLRDALFDTLSSETLEALSKDTTAHQCAAYADGIDYAYTITLGTSTTYTLDTCLTRLANDVKLQGTLIKVWEFMENPTTTYPVIIEKGPIQMIFDRFNRGGE